MNNEVGLKDMFEHKEALTLLARYDHRGLWIHYTFLGIYESDVTLSK
jgi:hypothetical protein